MGRTYRRGESFLLARHGRRSAVRPQVRSGWMGFNSEWILATLAPFYFVIRFSVIARQA